MIAEVDPAITNTRRRFVLRDFEQQASLIEQS